MDRKAQVEAYKALRASYGPKKAAADAELEAAEAAFAEWDAPRRRVIAARNAVATLDSQAAREELVAESRLRHTSDPRIAAALANLVTESDHNRAQFVKHGDYTNVDAVNARSRAILAATDRLKQLQIEYVPDVPAAIREIRQSIPSLAELEHVS